VDHLTDSSFRASDTPQEVVARVAAWVAQGRPAPSAEGDPLAIGKLRLAGVYDDRQPGFFMLRTRIPGGRLDAAQAEAVAEVATRHSRRPSGAQGPEQFVEVTTRQDLQLHWIRFSDLPAIWERYRTVGLTTLQACGDTLRNVTSCPLAGLNPGELLDVRPLVDAVTRLALAEPELASTLPRKFKVAITACDRDCVLARLHDLAFTPAVRLGRLGFHVYAGGGLSDYPRLASHLDLFVEPGQLPEVVRAALLLYRERGDFEHKAVNRFRRLVAELGPERTAAEIQARLPFRLPAAGEDRYRWQADDHLGVLPEQREGRVAVGLNVPLGRLAAVELAELARLARRYGDGELRLTQRQNVLLTGVREEELGELLAEPLLSRLRPQPDTWEQAVVACTSAPFCKFGILDAKRWGGELIEYLRRELTPAQAEALRGVRIHLSGCKASCAQTHAGHIGLRGTVAKDELGQYEGFDLALGGDPSRGRLARWLAAELPAQQAFARVADVLRAASAEEEPLVALAGAREEEPC
jgi:ferredoxin-nitrite reductase